jgi:hypothetical protein
VVYLLGKYGIFDLLRSAGPAMIQSRCLGTDRSEEERFERKGRFEGNSTS